MPYCWNCGAEISEGLNFCGHCGARVANIESPPVEGIPIAKQPERHGFSWGVVIVVLLVLAAVAGILAVVLRGSSSIESASWSYSTSRPSTYTVIYRVSGTAKTVDLTYENDSGNTEQRSNVELPWQRTYEMEPGSFLYVSAQNQGETGSVKCEIVVDGDVEERASSSGAYVIATCSGSVGW
jgi:hypothetical protein